MKAYEELKKLIRDEKKDEVEEFLFDTEKEEINKLVSTQVVWTQLQVTVYVNFKSISINIQLVVSE